MSGAERLSPELRAVVDSLESMRRDEQDMRAQLHERLEEIQAEARVIRRLLTSREYLGGGEGS